MSFSLFGYVICELAKEIFFHNVNVETSRFAYSGLTLSPKQQTSDRKSMDYWTEALKMLSQSKQPPSMFPKIDFFAHCLM